MMVPDDGLGWTEKRRSGAVFSAYSWCFYDINLYNKHSVFNIKIVLVLLALRFSLWYRWRMTRSGMRCRVCGCAVADVLKDPGDFIFWVKDSHKQSMETAQMRLLNPDEGSTMILWTTKNHMLDNSLSHPRKTESLIPVFWVPFWVPYHSWVLQHIIHSYLYLQ
jgi:hypothetical protein